MDSDVMQLFQPKTKICYVFNPVWVASLKSYRCLFLLAVEGFFSISWWSCGPRCREQHVFEDGHRSKSTSGVLTVGCCHRNRHIKGRGRVHLSGISVIHQYIFCWWVDSCLKGKKKMHFIFHNCLWDLCLTSQIKALTDRSRPKKILWSCLCGSHRLTFSASIIKYLLILSLAVCVCLDWEHCGGVSFLDHREKDEFFQAHKAKRECWRGS